MLFFYFPERSSPLFHCCGGVYSNQIHASIFVVICWDPFVWPLTLTLTSALPSSAAWQRVMWLSHGLVTWPPTLQVTPEALFTLFGMFVNTLFLCCFYSFTLFYIIIWNTTLDYWFNHCMRETASKSLFGFVFRYHYSKNLAQIPVLCFINGWIKQKLNLFFGNKHSLHSRCFIWYWIFSRNSLNELN